MLRNWKKSEILSLIIWNITYNSITLLKILCKFAHMLNCTVQYSENLRIKIRNVPGECGGNLLLLMCNYFTQILYKITDKCSDNLLLKLCNLTLLLWTLADKFRVTLHRNCFMLHNIMVGYLTHSYHGKLQKKLV